MVFNLIALFEIKSGHEEEMSQLLKKAAGIYKQDKHTIDWFIAQDAKEPTKFRVIERYTNQEEGIAEHRANPFYKEFGEKVTPWLAKPVELLFSSEL